MNNIIVAKQLSSLESKMQRELVVFFAVFGITFAALQRAHLEPKPDKYKDVEGCFISDIDKVIPFGQTLPSPNSCEEYWCGEKSVQIVSCSIVVVAPPLELVEDKDKLYPDCCPRLKDD